MKLDYLILAAHPDDAELCMGGTIAKLTHSGKKVGIVDLTQGEMGTRGTPETRLQEAEKAAEILGLSYRTNLKLPDTQLISKREYQIPIIREIRKTKPNIIFINAPDDRHPDHGNSAKLEIESIFYSGLRKIETKDDDGKNQDVWRPSHIIHYMQDRPFEPSLILDVTDFMEVREKAILAYGSQFKTSGKDDEPQTYISSDHFFNQIRGRALFYGHMIGADYAEPFLYHKGAIPINDFEFLEAVKPSR